MTGLALPLLSSAAGFRSLNGRAGPAHGHEGDDGAGQEHRSGDEQSQMKAGSEGPVGRADDLVDKHDDDNADYCGKSAVHVVSATRIEAITPGMMHQFAVISFSDIS
jgi:hypothetical protein